MQRTYDEWLNHYSFIRHANNRAMEDVTGKRPRKGEPLKPPAILIKYICEVEGALKVWLDRENAGDSLAGAVIAVLRHIERQRELCNEFAEVWLNRGPYDDGTLLPPDLPEGG